MVILFMIFLLPLTLDAYYLAGYGQFCSDSNRITTMATCQVAAAALSLNWGHGFNMRGDFPGCLHTRDRRNKVYFNVHSYPSTDPTSQSKFANYAEICTGTDPSRHYGLVVTGGDNPQRIASSGLISSNGVCVSPYTNIPNLPHATAGAKSVWIQDTLMFCGGSHTFVGHQTQYPSGWGAVDICLKVRPGDRVWDSNIDKMKVKRSWFSMNNINDVEAVAAGGMTTGLGHILDSIEKYSSGSWQMLLNNLGHPIKLQTATYGHCAVQYHIGNYPYLMIIAGSNDPTDFAVTTNAVTVIDLTYGIISPQSPGHLPNLWAPACVKKGGDIFVSGGGEHGTATTQVYKGTITGGFSPIGYLNVPRSGHTMGVTSTGQLFVAGGYDPNNSAYLKEVETSVDGGATWTTWTTMPLTEGGEYAAMASVPASTVMCSGVPSGMPPW